MRTVPTAMTTAWKAEDKTGDRRPVVRATVQKTRLRRVEYDTAQAPGEDFADQRHRKGFFTTIVMGDRGMVQEIRNIKSCSWSRSVDSDVAECTLTLLNTELTPIGNQEEVDQAEDFDLPGYMTYNRGEQTVSANRWGYDSETGWNGILVPDRLVKTYEGYGSDSSVAAGDDPNLLQSGTWLIDEVTYNADGDIEVKMRDVGRLLLDQIVFPPAIPYSEYPLEFEKIHSENVDGRDVTGGDWKQLKGLGRANSSNSLYIGKGLTNDPFDNYVGPYGGVDGHHDSDALANRDDAWWWSSGQDTPNSKVWWEVELDSPIALAGLRIHPKGGPYRIYISLEGPNGWIGKRKIPYEATTGDVNIEAGVPFVRTVRAEKALPFDVVLNRKYGNIKRIRLTFARLVDTGVGEHPFRAGLRDLLIYTAADVANLGFKKGTALRVVGNYRDFTDIVKWVCAWGGFFWPPHGTDLDFIATEANVLHYVTYDSPDPVLPKGRVWGDFMKSGTAGVAPLTMDLFDKRPLMDVINYVRDLLGFSFWIDETGGVVWRLPNLWGPVDSGGSIGGLGNYLSPGQLGQRTRARTAEIVTIDEEETLLNYSTTLSSRDLRERVAVGNTTGKVGTVIQGYNPYPQGFRRVAIWTDQNFETNRECRVMADMVAARQMFTYRRGSVTIPGYPAIQIDDQIRIYERVTNETYYHYVETIASTLNMDTGEWTYELGTHWLGERPSDAWVIRVDQLDGATQTYLNTVGGQ